VQGNIDAQLQLDKRTGMISIQGIGKYYEGTSCGRTNEHGSGPITLNLLPGESLPYGASLQDSDGHVIYNLTFKNES
jgi:hypothetical protein